LAFETRMRRRRRRRRRRMRNWSMEDIDEEDTE
jgi:hypothetical protein